MAPLHPFLRKSLFTTKIPMACITMFYYTGCAAEGAGQLGLLAAVRRSGQGGARWTWQTCSLHCAGCTCDNRGRLVCGATIELPASRGAPLFKPPQVPPNQTAPATCTLPPRSFAYVMMQRWLDAAKCFNFILTYISK